jgi:hypothetical protein
MSVSLEVSKQTPPMLSNIRSGIPAQHRKQIVREDSMKWQDRNHTAGNRRLYSLLARDNQQQKADTHMPRQTYKRYTKGKTMKTSFIHITNPTSQLPLEWRL